MRGRAALAAGALALALAGSALAQNVPLSVAPQSPVLTIKQQELFDGSAFGEASLRRIEALSRALQAENREIEASLETEERSLTERRADLPVEEFRALALAFDDKVEGIRAAQEAKAREVTRQREIDQTRFYENAAPVLAELVRAKGGVLLIDQSAVVLSLDAIDITDEAIALIDALLAAPPETGTAPAGPSPLPPAP